MKHLILGTAGHIDHGKTTLIQKLTGANTDRLNEEQERGISIDLGFASLELSNGVELGIIDVPGHEKFVKNMLAGAGGVDLALLVIAADEGVMPQTKEHLNILELLGVKEGIVAITKVDLVEEEWLELVKEDIRENLEDTFLAEAPLISVSGVTGDGINKLITSLENMTEGIATKEQNDNLYLPIDRSFSVAGFGTVITGTLMAGKLVTEAEAVIYPQEKEVEVKNIQVHNQSAPEAVAGQRTGVNLNGVTVDEINRGDILATPDSLAPTTLVDVKLDLLATAPLSLEYNDRLRIHIGAKEVFGRISILDKEFIEPGESAYVQLRLEEPIVAYHNQPFVIRHYSPMITIGGGRVLAANPKRHKRFDKTVLEKLSIEENGSTLQRIELALKESWQSVKPVDLLPGSGLIKEVIESKCEELVTNEQAIKFNKAQNVAYLHKDVYLTLRKQVSDLLRDYHKQYHLRWGCSKEEIRSQLKVELDKQEYDQFLTDLVNENLIEIEGAEIRLEEHQIKLSSVEVEVKEDIIDKFKAEPFTPPTLKSLKDDLAKEDRLIEEIFNLLVREGILKRVDSEIYFYYETLDEAERRLRGLFEERDEVTIGDYRNCLNSSRKYTLPLLNYFDQQGITKRVEDKRILID
ncbi:MULTISPECIES: selenocysteine-specific translation elongation factor [unclassified Candidatus Frackibacter]|uniref:selenocysteine-specific translation elongation factor n=1 Tax=unclassified Candidatus Frackibacter TaxID=2648818 RepID=UPI000883C397|nr:MULTISPECIES: selenocysteine-specific translation elongation factor [unclassified Candidatus Frackibacter]SDC45344.1 selenocysteine-specific elongation factor [Candidatus Frackibacter sp. WG11]SEM65191.1 selenocysteine-specific elongation factor [Candidatus Frackibacter sp. WG12]SFL67231.1 selenocysteine-specific elongation factor [Candidatus Frackibacter sp. WG13]